MVWLSCEDGVASYDIRSHVGSKLAEGTASVGDHIRATAQRGEAGWTQVTTTNLTTGEEVAMEGVVLPDEFATAVDFGAFPVFLKRIYPVPDVGAVKLTDSRVTTYSAGKTCLADTTPVQNTRVDKKTGEVEIDTTPVRGCRFSLDWRSH